jgi:hypothetical protein
MKRSFIGISALGLSLVLEMAPANAQFAQAYISVTNFATYVNVCGVGRSDAFPAVTGVWELVVAGERSNGSVIASSSPRVLDTRYDQCVSVDRQGASAGNFTAVLLYAGVGAEPVALANLTYGWA